MGSRDQAEGRSKMEEFGGMRRAGRRCWRGRLSGRQGQSLGTPLTKTMPSQTVVHRAPSTLHSQLALQTGSL